jgi:hypothetical protein
MRVKIVDATDGNEIDSEFLTKANFCPWHAYSLQPAQMGAHLAALERLLCRNHQTAAPLVLPETKTWEKLVVQYRTGVCGV